jgi:hypothetical protein
MPPAETSFLDGTGTPAIARPRPAEIGRQTAAILGRIDRVVLAIGALFLALAAYDRGQAWRTLFYTGVELAGIGPWLAASVLLAAAAKATGADTLIARSSSPAIPPGTDAADKRANLASSPACCLMATATG